MSNNELHNEIINRIARVPADVEDVLRGLDAKGLRTPYRAGGWTVAQVVHHVADTCTVYFIRAKYILTQEHPTLVGFDQDTWAALPDADGSIDASLAIIHGVHARWAKMLQDISEADWQRSAHHTDRGEVTLESLADINSRHGAHHVAQIAAFRRTNGV